MTEFLSRGLKILTLTLFLSSNSCYANTIRYVNINNPTPGDGTTWAKAFNDLQTALSTATIFEDIWIAKGTYLPSLPAGRSATFSVPMYVNIYGGFNGTETAVTQLDPTLNPTILSGDIGVAGNSSDNCYHVVTVNSSGESDLHDLTIRDGQADAGYPGSTVQQADNIGGGVLVLSGSGKVSVAEMYNCILRDNFAVYGGGIGAYGYGGGIQTSQGGYECLFYNNQAVYGGAVSASNDACTGMLVYQSCIFNNNTALAGNASVFASTMANKGPTNQLCQLYNCLFYNEAAPLFSVQTSNVPSFSYSVLNSIIWTAGTPYTGGYISGNGTFPIGTCDINGTLPAGSNIDADPLFVDAPGGDFHVSPCSPVIDKGFGWTSPGATTDYGGSERVQGVAIDLGPYETPLGAAAIKPMATAPAPYCVGATAAALSATGSNLLWYDVATGGTASATAPTPSTAAQGTTPYYVTQTPTGSCESLRQEVDVVVKPAAAVPSATAPSPYCIGATAAALSATGSNLLWYDVATGGAGSPTAPTPSTAAQGTTPYYVSQTPAASCESQRLEVDVVVKPAAAAPTATAPSPYCIGATAAALTATGSNLLWYDVATGGAGSPAAPTPSTAAQGTTPYYVTQTPTGSCESLRQEVDVVVKPAAAVPTATAPSPYCIGATAAVLTATGSNLLWYDVATGGTASATAPTPSTAAQGTTPYYVTQTPTGSCESLRQEVDVVVKPAAAAPTATAPSPYCIGATAASLTATGSNLLWYNAPTGGAGSPTAPTPSTAAQGTTSYYVSQTPAASCESARTPITVTITPKPTADFTWTDACIGKPALITVTSTAMLDQYTWDFDNAASATGSGTGPYMVTYNKAGNYIITLTTARGNCQNQVQHLVAVNALPVVDISPVTTTCAGTSVALLASGASGYQWSPATDLSDPSIGNPVALLQNDILYTVTGTDVNGCTATASITLKVSPDCLGYYLPNAFSPNGDGANDVFRVKAGDYPKSFSLLVFNRFGQKVFESANVDNGWNGNIGGNPAPTGAYIFVIVATTSSGTLVKRQGTVMLVR